MKIDREGQKKEAVRLRDLLGSTTVYLTIMLAMNSSPIYSYWKGEKYAGSERLVMMPMNAPYDWNVP